MGTGFPNPVPQPALSPPTGAAIFQVVTSDRIGEPVVQQTLSELNGLQRAIGFRATPDGRRDADGQPAKDTARHVAFTEDRVMFEGCAAADIAGLRESESNAPLDGDIVRTPAIDGATLLSKRGGDFELRLGQDLSVAHLSHDGTGIRLYFQETLTFLAYTDEAATPARAETPGPVEPTRAHA